MPDVVVHIQFVGSGSFCNAVDDGTGLCSPDGIDGHPVLASKSKISQCSFAGRIVDRNLAICQEQFQI